MNPFPSSLRRVAPCLALVAAGALLAACGRVGVAPTPTPADFGGIAIRLSQAGVEVHDIVSGDPGCPDSPLAPTAVSFTASGLDQREPVRIYVYIFRNADTLTRLRSEVDSCARSYVSDASTYQSVDVTPYVIAGQGPWGQQFEQAIRSGLTSAAELGG